MTGPKINGKYIPTPNELTYLRLLASGEAQRDIAYGFECSLHAMNVRLHRLRTRMEVDTNCELIAKAMREGIIK